MNVLLIGEESAGIETLHALERSGHRTVAVMASPSRTAASGASLWVAAQKMGIETWPARSVKDPSLAEKIRSEQVDIIFNVHSLFIIHRDVIAAPRIGGFNVHPGPLPSYAGLNAVSWAIFRGERSHGVTVHWMVPEIDAGPIAYQTLFPIKENDTALTLSARCQKEGVILLMRLLGDAVRQGTIPSIPQDLRLREYFGAEVPEKGKMSWHWGAQKIVNFVRACDYYPFRSPWGHPQTSLRTQSLAVVKACRTGIPSEVPPGTVGDFTPEGVTVASGDEWVLVSKVQVGKEFLTPNAVLKKGDRFADAEG